MEAYSIEARDAQGRPMIRQPINVDDLLQREGRTSDLGNGVRVYLEEIPSSRMLPRGYQEAPHGGLGQYATDEAQAAAQQYGFQDGGAHAPFAFGDVQQWYDVINAVQQGGGADMNASAFHHTQQQQQHAPHAETHHVQFQQPEVAGSPKRATSPPRGAHRSSSSGAPAAATAAPTTVSRKDQWASYSPVIQGPPRDFKKIMILDVTPDAKQRKFSPLPMAHHSCIMVEKGSSGSAHFLVFGGTNGRSDEAEWYEFSLVSASWRRLEVKRQAPPGCHSHTCISLEQGQRIAIVGGVSYEGPAIVPEELLEEKPEALKRLAFMCPKRMGRSTANINATMILDGLNSSRLQRSNSASRLQRSSSAGASRAGAPRTLDGLIPRLSEAHGVQLHASALRTNATGGIAQFGSPTRSSKRRAFQSYAFDADVTSMRWRAVQPPVAVNIAAHTATVFGSIVYLFGGVNELLDVSDKLIAMSPSNFSGRILRAQENAPCGRYYHTAVAYGHWIVVYGGFDHRNEPLNDLWAFDCVQETWEQLTTVGTLPHRGGHAACVVGCRMIIAGGFETSIDGEGAAPVNTLIEVNLVPAAKGYLVKTLPTKGAALPPMAFGTVTACGDHASVFVFGGITVKPKKKKAPTKAGHHAAAVAGSDNESNYSDDFDEGDYHDQSNVSAANNTAGGAASDGAAAFFNKFPVSNKAFLLSFGEVQASSSKKKHDGPKLNHLGLEIDENELSPQFKAFVRKQEDFIKKRDAERRKIIKSAHLEESEAAEVNLYLKPEEIARLMTKCGVCCTSLGGFDMKSLPGHVPDREIRERLVEECVGFMRQAKDVLQSMKGHEGPKQVKSKGHRKKTGEKFEDHSAAKPFRKVIVMDLIHRTNRIMIELIKMNKSLKTVEWPEKPPYLHFTHEIRRELVELVDLIKDILDSYINKRVDSLIEAEKKHQQNLAKLKVVTAKIQHDKIFKKDVPDARREHRKQVLARDDRKNRDQSPDGAKQKKRDRRRRNRSASPGSKHAELPKPGTIFKELLIEIPKEEAKQMIKRCDWVQKAATEFAWHCNATMSVPPAVVAAPSPDGSPASHAAPGLKPHQEAIIKDSDSARASSINLSNTIVHAVYHFKTILEEDMKAAPSSIDAQQKAAPLSTSTVAVAKETHTSAIGAEASAVNPSAPPVVPALPKPIERPTKDPIKNMMLRLSSSRPLMDNQAALRDLLHTIGRIRHNTWDPNDLGGPKQDEKAENLCRVLFHRATNLLTRINMAFLAQKGARSPRQKVIRDDPLMMTSDLMQKKMKDRKAAVLAAKDQQQPVPIPAITTVTDPQRPSVPAYHGQPTTSSTASWPVTGDSGKYPIQYAAAQPAGATRLVAEQPHQHRYSPTAAAPPPSAFSYSYEPMFQTFTAPSLPMVDDRAAASQHPVWIVNPLRYERPQPATPAAAAPPPPATATSTIPVGPIMAPNIVMPSSLFNPPTPVSAEAKPINVQTLPPGPSLSSPPPPVPQQPAASNTSVVAAVSNTTSVVPPPPARSSTPPPPQAASYSSVMQTSSTPAALPSSTQGPAATSSASTSVVPVSQQEAVRLVQPQPAIPLAVAKPLGSAPPPQSPVPHAPPAWIAPSSIALPSSSAAPQDVKPPVPVSVAPGPFNGGLGFLGTYSSTEDYKAVMMPHAKSVGFSIDPPVSEAKAAPKDRVSLQPQPVTHRTSGPVAAVGDPKFRGKLTNGERMILKARESNRH